MDAMSAIAMPAECLVHNLAVIVQCQDLTEAAVQNAMIKELAFIKTFPA